MSNNSWALFIIAINQVIDGALTYIGINYFGSTSVEGNIILRSLMHQIGVLETIVLAKIVALFLVVFLHLVIKYNPDRGYWFSIPLWFVAFIYSLSACVWVYVLSRGNLYLLS